MFSKKEDLVISIVAGAIAIAWIFTTFSVQQRLQQRLTHSTVMSTQLVK